MTKHIDNLLLLLTFCLIGNVAYGQTSTASPYSAFGIGTLTPQEHATTAGMGHTGVAIASSDFVNITNPAAINKLDSATFYFNLQMKGLYNHCVSGRERQSSYSANVDGVTMGFRVTRWWGAALGYAPYSSVGYKLYERKYIYGSETKYRTKYTGHGGMSRAYLNNAFTLFNHLSLGVSVGALWGAITKQETALFGEAMPGGENIYNKRIYTGNNFFFEYGFQYDFNIGQNNFRLGGVFNDKTRLASSYDHIVSNDISSELFFDDVTPLDGELAVPRSYAGGLTYTRNNLMFSVDYRFNEWGDVKNVKLKESAKFKDNWTAGGGVQYKFSGRPDEIFLKRMQLRLGYWYSTDYLKLQGMSITTLGVTAGMTVPVGRRNSLVISYEYQQRGKDTYGMIKETSQNIKLALNIKETWFVKSKFE